MNNYQKHVAYGCKLSYGCKLVCGNDTFSKPFKSYLGENAVYSFVNSIIVESKYCSDEIKQRFKKELVMTKDDEEFKFSKVL